MATVVRFWLFLLVSVLCNCCGNGTVIPWPPKVGWMDQSVDHFSFAPQSRTFKQRFFYDESKWAKPNGPIFFYAGNEGPIESFWNNTGLQFEMASQFHALVVFGEHRYYGKSMPFGNMSLQQPYIQYLAISQATTDYAFMIDHVKSLFGANGSAVIAFGGSYGGMLAAYMRFKYPNKVHGAVAASAPIYWVSGNGNLHQFFESITADFAQVNKSCPTKVTAGFLTIDKLAGEGTKGYEALKKFFNLCSAPASAADIRHIKLWARGAFMTLSMCDYPYPTDFLAPLPGYPVATACHLLLTAPISIMGLRRVMDLVYGTAASCHDTRKEFIECADITGCGTGPSATAWDFQACTQIILSDKSGQTSSDMFPSLPLSPEMIADHCNKTYGIVPLLKDLDTKFWGGDIKSASNIIFSNGNLDPWHLGGVLTNLTDSLRAFIIDGGAHHLDLRTSDPKDPPSVRQARAYEGLLINQWIKEHANNLHS